MEPSKGIVTLTIVPPPSLDEIVNVPLHIISALDYLKDTGVILKVHNLDVPSTPLSVNVIQNQFKVFPTDIGMLIGHQQSQLSKNYVIQISS